MKTPTEVFEDTLAWLRAQYTTLRFFTERDLVWAVQTRLTALLQEHQLPYDLVPDYAIVPGQPADLVLLHNGTVEVMVEFRYEPDHTRRDIPPTRFPIVSWAEDVAQHMQRMQELVDRGQVRAAYTLVVDEGNYFHKVHTRLADEWMPSADPDRQPHLYNQWQYWGRNIWVLYARVGAG